MAEPEGGGGTGAGGWFIRKLGPLPMWAWMAVALAALLAITTWQRNKADAETAQDATTGPARTDTPDNLQPMYTFVDADTTLQTVNVTPSSRPKGGRTVPPTIRNKPAIIPAGENPRPRPFPNDTIPVPTPAPTPTPAPAAPAGQWSVPIIRWASGQASGTPSTLWGLAVKYYGNGSLWRRIWDAPQNSGLKSKHGGNERLIQPGETYWIPA